MHVRKCCRVASVVRAFPTGPDCGDSLHNVQKELFECGDLKHFQAAEGCVYLGLGFTVLSSVIYQVYGLTENEVSEPYLGWGVVRGCPGTMGSSKDVAHSQVSIGTPLSKSLFLVFHKGDTLNSTESGTSEVSVTLIFRRWCHS